MFIALERLINLDEGYRRSFQVAGRSLLLLVVEGHGEEVWFAMDAVQHVTQGAAHLGSP